MPHSAYIRRYPHSRCAVLFLHGILGTPRHFDPFLPLVPADFSVYAPLLAGHGGSVEDFSRSSMKKWKEQAAAIIDRLCADHEQVFIAAHSMGALLALENSLRRRNIVGLFLLAPPLSILPRPAVLYQSCCVAFDRVPPNNPALQAARRMYSITPDRRVLRYLGWIPRYLELFREIRLLRKRIDHLAVPCTAYLSAKDELISRRAARWLPPHCRIRILPHSRHFYYPPQDLALLRHDFKNFCKEKA